MNDRSQLLGLRSRLYVSVSRVSAHLPAFRGRTRIFLLLHRLLGLGHHKLLVDARLRRPVPFLAYLDIQSWLQRIAFLTGGYESETVDLLHRLWRSRPEGGYLLDIGANVGMISIPFALMARSESTVRPTVIAVEAVPDNSKALQINIDMNDLRREIVVIEAALGDVEKTIQIQVEGDLAPGEGSGTANILPDGSSYARVTQSLRLRTLDGLLEPGQLAGTCAVIKLDTDGYDLKVLEGAAKFLKQSRPVIFGEFSAEWMGGHDQSIDDVAKFAESHEYDLLFRLGKSPQFVSAKPEAGFVQDLLLVPIERRSDYAWCRGATYDIR